MTRARQLSLIASLVVLLGCDALHAQSQAAILIGAPRVERAPVNLARQPYGPSYTVDSLGIAYRDDRTTQEEPAPGSREIQRLERRYGWQRSSALLGLELALGYVRTGRPNDAIRVLAYFVGRRNVPFEVYAALASLHFERGDYYLAEVVTESGLEVFPGSVGLRALHTRARARRGEFVGDIWEMRHLFAAPHAEIGLRCISVTAFEKGDFVSGLLAAEALYFTAGYTGTTRVITASVEVTYDTLLRASLLGRAPLASDYAAGSFSAGYYADILAAVDDAAAQVPHYSSRLELFARIRERTLERYLSRVAQDPAAPKPTDPLVGRLLDRVAEVHEAGLLRWYTLASLRDLDREYFSSLVRENPREYEELQLRFPEFTLDRQLVVAEGPLR